MGLFQKYSAISRKRKHELFFSTFAPTQDTIILDVGAEANPKENQSLHLIDTYPWKHNIHALNLLDQHIQFIKNHYPEINAFVGDACDLPWPDKHFDIVYSNAVIEHVGNYDKQQKMAREIMRVGKSWFVTTPNRWYPFEFHRRLPLITWLPGDAYLWISKLIAYNHVKKRYIWGGNRCNLRLLSAKQMRHCFPDSKIIKQRVTFFPETLIAVGGEITKSL